MNSKKIYDISLNVLKYFVSGLALICFLLYVYLYFKFEGNKSDRQKGAVWGVIMFLYFFPAMIVAFIRQLYNSILNLIK